MGPNMSVSLENNGIFPLIVPIPQLDGHIVTGAHDKGQRGMDSDAANVISVSLKLLDLLASVVIVDANVHIIGTAHEPVLTLNELGITHRNLRHFEGTHDRLRVVVPNKHVARIQGAE